MTNTTVGADANSAPRGTFRECIYVRCGRSDLKLDILCITGHDDKYCKGQTLLRSGVLSWNLIRFVQKNLCTSILGIPSLANSPYPIEMTIVIKAKAPTTATVMQPAVNLQKTSAPTENPSQTPVHLRRAAFGLSCLPPLVTEICSSLLTLFHVSVCGVIGVYTHEQSE